MLLREKATSSDEANTRNVSVIKKHLKVRFIELPRLPLYPVFRLAPTQSTSLETNTCNSYGSHTYTEANFNNS